MRIIENTCATSGWFRIISWTRHEESGGVMTTTVVLIRIPTAAAPTGRAMCTIFYAEVRDAGLQNEVQWFARRPRHLQQGMVAKILPQGIVYAGIADADVDDIVTTRWRKNAGEQACILRSQRAVRIVMRNCGIVNPECIEDYIARKGYQGIKRALYDLTPEKAIED